MADYSLDQQIQIVQEGRKRGFTDSQIAGRLGLPSDDPVFKSPLCLHDKKQRIRAAHDDFVAAGLPVPDEITPGTLYQFSGGKWAILFHDLTGAARGDEGEKIYTLAFAETDAASVKRNANLVANFATGKISRHYNGMKAVLSPLGLPMAGVADGWREWEFFGWPNAIKEAVLILLARVAESSYRRGLQQGYWAASTSQKMKIHPDKLRWDGEPLDSARMFLCGTKMSSRERLSIQHGFDLQALGIWDADDQEIH